MASGQSAVEDLVSTDDSLWFMVEILLMSGEFFPYKKLESWRLAKALAVRVYLLTASFPKDERFGLVDQMRRAGVSVMSNLAEGCGRTSSRDQAHFSQIAFGSLLELDAQHPLALDLGFLNVDDYLGIRLSILELIKKISALRASQLKRAAQ